MSNKHLFMTAGLIRAPLQNGIGRYVCQLKRVTLKFCKSQGDSKGIREFIESDLIDFSKKNPGVVVYVKPRRHRSPSLTAEYLNGQTDYINCHNYSRDEVNKWLTLLLTRSGREVMRYCKNWQTDFPSVQGVWSPFTFRDPEFNLASFPLETYWGPPNLKMSATEKIIELFKQQQLEEKSDDVSDSPEKENKNS